MASYSTLNGQEWLVAKQRIQRPKDHDILTSEPTNDIYMLTLESKNLLNVKLPKNNIDNN